MWHSLRGYVIIQVQGTSLERFLNTALGAGIRLTDVCRTGRGLMTMALPARDFLRKLPAVRRKCRCRVHILKRRGMPFLFLRLQRRKVLLVGSLLCGGLIAFGSTRILHVEVEGAYRVPEAVVLRALSEAGITPGMARKDVNRIDLARVVNDYDQRIAWAGITTKGISLRVEIVEAEEVPDRPDESEPADVTAGKDGVIEKVTARVGKASVKPGDAVRAGDILIRGDITREGAQETLLVHAEGEVLARVWYTGRITLPATEQQLVRSGETAPYQAMELMGLRLYETEPPFSAYEREITETLFVPGPVLPLRQFRGIYHRMEMGMVSQPRAELEAEAAFRAELMALDQIPKGAAILEKQVDVTWDPVGGATATAQVCTLEDIGETNAVTIQQIPAPAGE